MGRGLALGVLFLTGPGEEGWERGSGELEACLWTGQPAVPFLQRNGGRGRGMVNGG